MLSIATANQTCWYSAECVGIYFGKVPTIQLGTHGCPKRDTAQSLKSLNNCRLGEPQRTIANVSGPGRTHNSLKPLYFNVLGAFLSKKVPTKVPTNLGL